MVACVCIRTVLRFANRSRHLLGLSATAMVFDKNPVASPSSFVTSSVSYVLYQMMTTTTEGICRRVISASKLSANPHDAWDFQSDRQADRPELKFVCECSLGVCVFSVSKDLSVA